MVEEHKKVIIKRTPQSSERNNEMDTCVGNRIFNPFFLRKLRQKRVKRHSIDCPLAVAGVYNIYRK